MESMKSRKQFKPLRVRGFINGKNLLSKDFHICGKMCG